MDAEIKNKIGKVGIELVLGYINSLGADLTNRFLFGGKSEVGEVLQKVDELLRENKLGEAQAVVSSLRGRMTAMGETDEEMIFQDIMEIQRLGLVDRAKARETAAFLAGLTPQQRRRIRKGNMAEPNSVVRQNKWMEFCNCENNDERIAYLTGFGFNDPTELERLQNWDQQHFELDANFAEANADLRVHEARQAINGPRIKPRGWRWLNPFR
jgi:hypothetical protein